MFGFRTSTVSSLVENPALHCDFIQTGIIKIYFQNFDALSRKSSAGSTGSLDRSEFLLEKAGSNESRLSRPVMRHDENGVSGVRAKIALFSNGGGNGSIISLQNTSSSSLTRYFSSF